MCVCVWVLVLVFMSQVRQIRDLNFNICSLKVEKQLAALETMSGQVMT